MPPDGIYPRHHTTSVVSNTLIVAAVERDPTHLNRFDALIIGCVVYRIEGDSRIHRTPFSYRLYRWLPDHPSAITLLRFVVGTEYPADTLRLDEDAGYSREPD